jgi:hypothetical protein
LFPVPPCHHTHTCTQHTEPRSSCVQILLRPAWPQLIKETENIHQGAGARLSGKLAWAL